MKITQDFIAKQLNISRNTVSKVFNNKPGISEKTRKTVLEKAAEFNYQPNIAFTEDSEFELPNNASKDIAFVCSSDSFVGAYWTPIVKRAEFILRQNNYNFRLVIIRNSDEISSVIPSALLSSPPAGIIMAGYFSCDYYKRIIELGFPTVSLDISPDIAKEGKICDVVLMDDINASYYITRKLIERGHTKISFAGDKLSCWTFYRRWLGFKQAMDESGLEIVQDIQFDFSDDNRHFTAESFYNKLKNTPDKPTAFMCANDKIALAVDRLCSPPYSIYNTIDIGGFDNCADFPVTSPNFMTVEVHPRELGKTLAEQIIWRINNPDRKYRFIEVDSTPILK